MNRTLAVVLLTTSACGGKITLDPAAVDARLDRFDETVPLCASADGAAMRAIGHALRAAPRRDDASLTRAGSCGGSLDVTSAHESGVTDYAVTATAFCLNSAEGALTLDGALAARQIGKPSDAGPVISAFELSTDGPVTLASPSGTITLALDGARADYGVPAAWIPGVPDAEHPDVVTIRSATATFDVDGRVDFVRDVRFERVGAAPATITIDRGEAGTEGEGYVDVRTADGAPLTYDFGQLAFTSGTLELVGRGGTVVTVTPSAPATFAITLDGAPYDRGLDCAAARAPLVEGLAAVIEALPID